MGLTSKAFSDIITFSRSSNATRVGPDGKIAYAPHNLLTYSAQFDNAAWTKENVSITANAIAAPDGTVTADKIIPDTVNTQHRTYQVASVAGASGTHSVYAKAGEYSIVAVRESNTTGNYAVFNLATGTIFAGYTASSPTITAVGNGWYRLTINIPNTTTQALGVNVVSPSYTSGSPTASWVADGTSGLYIWGAQLSVGSIAGDYTATTSAAVYGPRFDYDPVTLAAKGLLIEEQRTNLITYSEDFSTSWYSYQCTVTANSTSSPDGTNTADTLSSGGSPYGVMYKSMTVSSGAAYTASIFVKAGTASTALVGFSESSVDYAVYVNLSLGTITSVAAGITAAIVSYGNGWYRVVVTRTTASTSINLFVGANAASGTIYAWGAQMEAGAFATSYIPTVASTVTRSADVASVNTLSPWFNAVEGTLFAQFDEAISSSSITNQVFASLNDGTANNEMLLYRSGGGFDARFAILTSGALQADVATSITIAQNTAYKTAGAYKLNDIAASTSGNTPGTDTSATIPTVSALQIGGGRSTTAFSGHLRRLAYYPRRLTNAELQALTA